MSGATDFPIPEKEFEERIRRVLQNMMFCPECGAALEHVTAHLIREAKAMAVFDTP